MTTQVTATQEQTVLLQLSNVWKRFPGVVALKDVSFAARAGEVHALLGENGAGKSTLMSVAGGEVVPDEGTIALGDGPVDRYTPEAARAGGLAIVHQHPALLPDPPGAENLALAVPGAVGEGDQFGRTWMRAALDRVGGTARLSSRIEELTV